MMNIYCIGFGLCISSDFFPVLTMLNQISNGGSREFEGLKRLVQISMKTLDNF